MLQGEYSFSKFGYKVCFDKCFKQCMGISGKDVSKKAYVEYKLIFLEYFYSMHQESIGPSRLITL